MQIESDIKPRSVRLEMVVTKADGRRLDLGVVDYYHKNPLKNLYWAIKIYFAARKRIKAQP